jgi:MFS family permease
MSSMTPAEDADASRRKLITAAILIVIGVIATTLAQPQVLGRLPLQNLLKNQLHVSRESSAAFFFWIGMPWYLKPIAGILTDAFPILGSRRKLYLIASSVLTSAGWIAIIFLPHAYGPLLWGCLVLSIFQVVASSAIGGYMVEVAQAVSGSGRLTAVRNFVDAVVGVLVSPAAGFLASIAFGWTALLSGGVALILAPAAIFLLAEQRKRVNARQIFSNAGQQLGNVMSARTMWSAIGLMALFYIAPGFGTALFYRQQNELHMTTQMQGFNGFLGSVAAVSAALLYGVICRKLNLRTLLLIGLGAATIGNLGYLGYTTVFASRIIDPINGFCFTLAELSLMDLAVRATPAGSESVGFSLMMSIRNIGLFGSDWAGSAMIDRLHTPINLLILVNSGTTLITLPLVFLLPAVLVWKKDEELYVEPPASKTAIQV